MKRSRKLALCAVIAALSSAVMLAAYVPYTVYAVPALAGMLIPVVLLETGKRHAFGCFVAAALVSLLICEKEAAVLYAAFFGWYPIVKQSLESLHSRVLEWILKLLAFNLSFAAAYAALIFVFGITPDQLGYSGKVIFLAVFALLGNGVFIVYDVGLSRVITLYVVKYRDKLHRLIK